MNTYTKELDGLRGLAVLLIITFHVFERAAYFTEHPTLLFITKITGAGIFGVDVFFTLSGFLITSILLQTRGQQGYFRNFYFRRILRIFPLYFLGVAAIIIFFAPWHEPGFKTDLWKTLPIMVFYLQNWAMIFNNVPMREYLGVTWSLAVEEQFYLLWPLVIQFFEREKAIRISLWVIGLSIFLRVMGFAFGRDTFLVATFFYFNSFTRFEEILMGGLLALCLSMDGWAGRIKKYAFPVFAVLLVLFLMQNIFPYFTGFKAGVLPLITQYSLIAMLTASLIALFRTQPEGIFLRRIFRNGILVFFGKYSYSMYLFHMTVAVILKDIFWDNGFLGWKAYISYIILVYLLTIIVALLTWHLLEKHMLGLKKYFEYSPQPK